MDVPERDVATRRRTCACGDHRNRGGRWRGQLRVGAAGRELGVHGRRVDAADDGRVVRSGSSGRGSCHRDRILVSARRAVAGLVVCEWHLDSTVAVARGTCVSRDRGGIRARGRQCKHGGRAARVAHIDWRIDAGAGCDQQINGRLNGQRRPSGRAA